MTEAQLIEAEAHVVDGLFRRKPNTAATVREAALAEAARMGRAAAPDLPRIRRLTALASKLERIR